MRRIVDIHSANSLRRWREVVRWGVCQLKMRQRNLIGLAAASAADDDDALVDNIVLLIIYYYWWP